jgi:hypothetical protein
MLRFRIDGFERAFTLQIGYQHSKVNDTLRDHNYVASNGWVIATDQVPAINLIDRVIYLRGSDTSGNARVVRVYDLPSNLTRDKLISEISDALNQFNYAVHPVQPVLEVQALRARTLGKTYKTDNQSPWTASKTETVEEKADGNQATKPEVKA